MERRRQRIYWRERGGARRAYADFRDFADVGGSREALVVSGEQRATADRRTAEVLAAKRLNELDALRARRRAGVLHQLPKQVTLATFASEHLVKKAEAGKVTPRWLMENQHFLSRAAAYLGAKRDLSSITVDDVTRWAGTLLQSRPTGRRSRAMSGATVRHHLNALSNLFRRAQAEGYVPPGYNPVAAMMEKPTARRREARWLEVHDAALLLEAARTHDASSRVYSLIGAFLLTGGRESEVLGLEVGDVSFDRRTVTFRPNDWRRLKTLASFRTVPLWPQLEEILRPYVFAADRPPSKLLFPSYRTGDEAMVTDFRKLLDAVAVRAGWRRGEIRSKMFRHTYCGARLQTLDQGAPISEYTVAKELGHGGDSMVKRVYGHLGQVRHRSDVIEYRVEQHAKVLGERLAAVRATAPFGTTIGTTVNSAL
jgi:integrase